MLPITNTKKHSRFKHKKKHIPQEQKKINFHVKKKEKHYSTFVQLNNENQYWHEDLLLLQHMDVAMKLLYETKLQH